MGSLPEEDKQKLDNLSKSLRNLEEENVRQKKTLTDLTSDLEERKSEGGDTKKYDVLFERDKEMTAFIESFAGTKDKEIVDQQKIQVGSIHQRPVQAYQDDHFKISQLNCLLCVIVYSGNHC